MEKRFVRSRFENFTGWLLVGCGAFFLLFPVFLLFADSEMRWDEAAALLLIGLFFFAAGSAVLTHNRNAWVRVSDETLEARYRWRKHLKLDMKEIRYADNASIDLRSLRLIMRDGSVHTLIDLAGAMEVCAFIRGRIPGWRECPSGGEERRAELLAVERAAAEKRKKRVKLIIGSLILAFVGLIALVVLAFRESERGIAELLIAIAAALAVTIGASMKTEKENLFSRERGFELRKLAIFTTPLPAGGKEVFTDDDFTVRVAVIGLPHSESVYYSVERFQPDFTLARVYDSDLRDSRESLLADMQGLNEIHIASEPA